MKLKPLIDAQEAYHFRFHRPGQIVDVWQDRAGAFCGQIISYAYAYTQEDEKSGKPNAGKLFWGYSLLDAVTAQQAYKLEQQVAAIPTEDSIKNWDKGFTDGISFMLEISTPDYYTYKTYGNPASQDSTVAEAKQIVLFTDSIYNQLPLKTAYRQFYATLKPGSYTCDHFVIRTKLSKKQLERVAAYEPHRQYLETIADTLNYYLADTVLKILIANRDSLSDLTCYLEFSSRNRLKKIRPEFPLEYEMDKKEFNTNRRKIKKTFRQVRFSFVHCRVHYFKMMQYNTERKKITFR